MTVLGKSRFQLSQGSGNSVRALPSSSRPLTVAPPRRRICTITIRRGVFRLWAPGSRLPDLTDIFPGIINHSPATPMHRSRFNSALRHAPYTSGHYAAVSGRVSASLHFARGPTNRSSGPVVRTQQCCDLVASLPCAAHRPLNSSVSPHEKPAKSPVFPADQYSNSAAGLAKSHSSNSRRAFPAFY